MELTELKRHWNKFGQDDPMWAILIRPDKQHGRWEHAEFFQTGETEIDRVMGVVNRLNPQLTKQKALDFGCGVGRLAQALCRHFAECHGVDIAPSMIEGARSYNRHGHRCHYHVNDKDDLSLFESTSFDFVYSNIVLQHMRQQYSHRYIREFVRILKPGGIAVFQIPGKETDIRELDYRADLTPGQTTMTLRAGTRAPLVVRARNISEFSWPAVNLGNHWLNDQGKLLIKDDGRVSLPTGLEVDQEASITLMVTAPAQPGEYFIELDCVLEGIVWFKKRGSATTRVHCQVTPSRRLRAPAVYHKLARFYHRMMNRLNRPRRPVATPINPEPQPAAPVASDFEPRMEMYCTPKSEMLKLLADCGAKVLQVERDYSAGCTLESWRYYVTK